MDKYVSVSSALHNGTVLYRINGENRDEALEELLATLPQTGELDITGKKPDYHEPYLHEGKTTTTQSFH